MDSQHIQGEGVPPQAGEGQRHHRPDQWYLSLHPPTGSFCLSQRTAKQEVGEMDRLWEKEPLESGWPALLGFSHQRRLLKNKKDTGGFLWRDAHTCAF